VRWPGKLAMMAVCAISAVSAAAQMPVTSTPKPDAALPEILQAGQTYRLWPGRAPGAGSDDAAETPTITAYLPPWGWGNGTAVVIAPGGGYVTLSGGLEGVEPASWFTRNGVTAFVLQYRVGAKALLPLPLMDGARAMRFVRAHAAEFNIDPKRVGMMGFSAGGHLALSTAVEATAGEPNADDPIERVSSRPDFIILGYPALDEARVRKDGTSLYCDFVIRIAKALCDAKKFASYQPTTRVTPDTPPTFIYHTTDDGLVPVEDSIHLYLALRAAMVPVEFHGFETGPHGTGLGGSSPSLSRWPELLQEWMRAKSLLPHVKPAPWRG
jgi:acetyl esterase/lipase